MSDQKQDDVHPKFHREGDALVIDPPQDPDAVARDVRANEQHEFARSQVKMNRRLTWFTGALMIATFCTIGVGIWQGIISQRSSNAAKEAAEAATASVGLARQEIAERDGAFVVFSPQLNILSSLSGDTPVFISQVNAAPGRVPARNVAVELTVQRIALPSEKPIESYVRCDLHLPVLTTLMTGMHDENHICELPRFNQAAGDEVMFTRQSVTIKGFLQYDNGFGQTTHEDICQTFLGYRYKGEVKLPNGTTNLVSGEDASFHPCADFNRVLHRAMLFKRKYQENYIPDHP